MEDSLIPFITLANTQQTTSKFPGQFEHFVNYLEMEFSIATNVVKDNFIHITV